MEELLEGLFKWTHEVVLEDSFGEQVLKSDGTPWKVYQRVVGDAEIDMARQTALRHSATLRKRLRNSSDLDRMTIIPDYSILTVEQVIALIVLNELSDIRAEASRDLLFSYPEQPTGSDSLEEQEKYQELVDTYFERREAKLQEEVNKLIVIRREHLEQYNEERLRKVHEESAIQSACREEMISIFNEVVTYFGTYSDAEFTTKAFGSYNTFKNASSVLKSQLIQKYTELEVSGQQLKK